MLSLRNYKPEPTHIFTYLVLGFIIQNMTFSLSQDKVLTIKAQATKVSSSLTSRGVMRLLGLTNFVSMALPLARLHSHYIQYWLKKNYKTASDLFKGLKPDTETSQDSALAVHLQATTKSTCRPLIEKVVTTDAPKEGY